jgi:uncharacterized protein
VSSGSTSAQNSSWREDLAGESIFHRFVGEKPHEEAVRALAVDGGGIRGILPALIGAELELRTGKHLAELFDFVVGTSTGTIIALGLATPGPDGKPKWTAREGAEIYANRGQEIFSKPKFSTGVFHEKYRHESFERLLDELWGDTRLSEATVDCVATSYELTARKVHHFDSREAKLDPARDFEMKAVVRAATAAPTFFEPARSPRREEMDILIDGAIYANNPAMVAFTEVQRKGATDMMLVSLGTGDEVEAMQWEHVRDWGLAQWARPILNVVFDAASESVDYQLRHLLGPERYHRFQVPLHHASHRLDDASPANIALLAEEAGRMIEAHDAELDHLCEKLVR